jgi:hypothetical protein
MKNRFFPESIPIFGSKREKSGEVKEKQHAAFE